MQNKNKDMCIITGKSLKLHKKIVFEKKETFLMSIKHIQNKKNIYINAFFK